MLLGIYIDRWEDYQVDSVAKPVMVITRAQKKNEIEQCNPQQLKLQEKIETEAKVNKTNSKEADKVKQKGSQVRQR
jgi:hypothetical protein